MRLALTPLLLALLISALACGPSTEQAATNHNQTAQSAPADPAPGAAAETAPEPAATDAAAPAAADDPAAPEDTSAADEATKEEWIQADPPAGQSAPAGNAAPPFKVNLLDGTALSSESYYGKKPVSITLWATWCGPCVMEIPVLKELYDDYKDQVEFLAISVDDPRIGGKVKEFVKKHGINYPVAHDLSKQVINDFETDSIPFTLFVNAKGEEVGRLVGFMGREHMIKAFEEAFSLKKRTPAADGETDERV